MDRSVLAARIQDILKGRSKPASSESVPAPAPETGPDAGGARLEPCDEEAAFAARCAADEAASTAREVLGGEVIDGPAGRCLVVDRRYDASHVHGRDPVERYASAAAEASHSLNWFLGSAQPLFSTDRFLFFDLETTGLSGGAGTYAFLVGCASFDGADIVTRQFFLRGYGEERALLECVRSFVDEGASLSAATSGQPPGVQSSPPSAGGPPPAVLMTYNGRAFDLPLIETRYLLHRRESPFASLPHVDMLFPARRLWKRRLFPQFASSPFDRVMSNPANPSASCALTALEQDILGLRRDDDVPGWEIPARYFTYARTGDPRGLVAVLEHNRLDLLSLAAVSALILDMVAHWESPGRGRHECLALARLLDYLQRPEEAERCYERAAAPDGLVEAALDAAARAEALRWLALHRRRARRFAEAAEMWRELVEIKGLPPALRREGLEALAIHAEHRAKDLAAARRFALGALDVSRGSRHVPEVERRLGRLHRKLSAPAAPAASPPTQPSFPPEA